MFYLAVEEYVMRNRQRELAKELEIKRQLHDSLDSKPDNGLHLHTRAVAWLRSPESVFEASASKPVDDKTSIHCVVK
jgi:hypothetical protein